MQPSDQAEKIRAYFDGQEVVGLVSVGERPREEQTVEVPSFSKIRPINNGITKYTPIEMKFKLMAGANTLQFFRDYYEQEQVKLCTISRTDGHGVEFARTNYMDSECYKLVEPAYDAASPNYAQITIGLVFDDRKDIV
jgi:hypothetical protein